jgi:hypothetical protein
MLAMLDGKLFFEQSIEIEAGGFKRDFIERSVAGLDGQASIDLGRRGRKVIQRGQLRAVSREQLRQKAAEILEFLDGREHTLEFGQERYENLRLDSFKLTEEGVSGGGVTADYEIVYMQLKEQM